MARLSLSLLGPFQAALDGEPITAFDSNKVRALLAYLAVEAKRPHSREKLAGLLWPERSDRDASANLRYALSNLRLAIGDREASPPFLLVSRQTIQFNSASDACVDVTAFAELVASPAPGISDLERAVGLYQGEFLEGFFLGDSVAFEEWVLLKREQFGRQVCSALHHLAAMCEQRGECERALPYAWRQVELDPWQEQARRQLMRLLALSGQRAAALAQYEAFRRALAEELGVEPARATTALYEQIRDAAAELLMSPTAHPLKPPPRPPAFLDEVKTQPEAERPLFVARGRELARLDAFLDLALGGHGQVVFVTGEAGSGKTALLAEFARRAQDANAALVVAGGNGVAYTGAGDPYHPFREILSLLTGEVEARWRAGAVTGERARRLWGTLPLACAALVADGPDLIDTLVAGKALAGRARAFAGADWLAELEGLVGRKADSPAGAGPPQPTLFAQYTRVLLSLAQRVPLLLVLDDLQWADAGSISLLFHLGRQLGGSRILIVGAYRPEEVALGRGGERHPLEAVVNEFRRDLGDVLVDLDQVPGREFVDALLDSEPNRLEAVFRDTLYRQTRGHPLFTVELLRGMQERGDVVHDQEGRWVEGPALDWKALPARVGAVIAERIGRLPEVLQGVLRAASVEGEMFTAEVVARVQAAGERETARWLSDELDRKHRLVSGQDVQHVGGQRLSRFRFRHILFQRYLYNSLGEVERARLHEDVGSALEALHEPGTRRSADLAPQLAWHFQQAGNVGKAIDYLRQAGERAVRMSANEEAVAHLTQALALLETLPETPERAQSELMLQACLIVPLQVLRGYGDPEVGRACARARELCRQMGETPQIFPILWLLAIFHGTRGENLTTHELTEQLLGMAERSGDVELVVLASFGCGWNQVMLGNPAQARVHFERVTANYDPQRHRHLAYGYGQDVAVSAGTFGSWALWLLGYPDQALQKSREALTQAQQLEHPPSLAVAQGIAATFHMLRGDAQAVLELSEALVRVSTEHGFEYWLQTGIFQRGWALVEQGQVAEGIAQMAEGRARILVTGAQLQHPLASACLGRAYGKMGKVEEGLALLDEALEGARRNSDGFVRAEIHRIRGELLWLQGDEAGAEASFHRAIEMARQQSAKSWELRAMVSLCRLWQKQGRHKQARKELAEIYGWFTEGFDTPDLQEAKALLEELAEGTPARATPVLYEQIRDGKEVWSESGGRPSANEAAVVPAPMPLSPAQRRLSRRMRLALAGGGLAALAVVAAILLLVARKASFRGGASTTPTLLPAPGAPVEGKLVSVCEELYADASALPPQICVTDYRTGRRVQITDDLAFEGISGLAWSPDGQQIVFSANPPGRTARLHIINADGSDLRRLTDEMPDIGPAWSPDGQWIVFTRRDDLWLVRPDGLEPHVLLAVEGFYLSRAVWAPDSQRIAFLQTPIERGSLYEEVWVVDRDGTAPRQIYAFERSEDEGVFLGWSPDGRRVGCFLLGPGGSTTLLVAADGSGEVQEMEGMLDSWLPEYWPPWGGAGIEAGGE